MSTSNVSNMLLPTWRRFRGQHGPTTLQLGDSEEAKRFLRSSERLDYKVSSPEIERARAVAAVRRLGGNPHNELHVLGQHSISFGKFRGMPFVWVASHSPGYGGFLVASMEDQREVERDDPVIKNKFLFREYLRRFPEGREIIASKAAELESKKKFQPSSLLRAKPSCSWTQTQPPPHPLPPVEVQRELTDAEMVKALEALEKGGSSVLTAPSSQQTVSASMLAPPPRKRTPTSTVTLSSVTPEDPARAIAPPVSALEALPPEQDDPSQLPLPKGWLKNLNKEDQRWIARALFRWSETGKVAVLDEGKINGLWVYPPQPAPTVTRPPRPDLYFASKLLLWMPKRLWKCVFRCPRAECKGRELISAGLYQHVRKVLDVDGFYYLAAEYLQCPQCTGKVITWSLPLLRQLDYSHRAQFPVVLTYQKACDVKVVRSMRQRSLGNGPMALARTLEEQHSERYLQQLSLYLEDCRHFTRACQSGLVTASPPAEPPAMERVSTYQWLQAVYLQDTCEHLEDVQATITSVFGSILKMDSTKKITKKLTGRCASTASWATNVGNEHGQVLMSVLTTHEGEGLDEMLQGLQSRYDTAHVPPPLLLYVDRDCCSPKLRQMLQNHWSSTQIRLDIWHFMRRLATGVTTESHQLYSSYMARLSRAIFVWNQDDLDALIAAKRSELEESDFPDPSDQDALSRLTRRELALHCRRSTRGAEETEQLITQLIDAYTSAQGRDTLGVPLLNSEQTRQIWEEQKRHLRCLQDPPDVSLYTVTGKVVKGGRELPVYRCARGSTSLESFHLHLCRFIPGDSASDVHYQAYLLNGLVRWNQDRANAAMKSAVTQPRTYSGKLQQHVNMLSTEVLGQPLLQHFQAPRKYTGERIGVEYLLHQSSESLLDKLDPERRQSTEEKLEVDEGFLEAGDDSVAEEPVDGTLFPFLEEDARAVMERHRPSTQAGLTHPPEPPAPLDLPGLSSCQGVPAAVADVDEECVGPDGASHYQHVLRLAHLLVFNRNRNALTGTDVQSIISAYDSMDNYDKGPITMEPRYRETDHGRFKAKGKSSHVPGVLSTKRCFLSSNHGPAQRVDSSRLLEAIISRLLEAYPSDTTIEGRRTSRWSIILAAYGRIRRLVLQNPHVMEATRIQLPDINLTTLRDWYNRRVKRQERQVLEQGLPYKPPPMTTAEPFPPPRPQVTVSILDAGDAAERHQFHLPASTTGTAVLGRRRPEPVPVPFGPKLSTQAQVVNPNLIQPTPSHPGPSGTAAPPCLAVPTAPVPTTTNWYRKRRLAKHLAGEDVRINKRHKLGNTCKQCGGERLATTHKQYYGAWWCQTTSHLTHDQWLEEQKRNRTVKKKAPSASATSTKPAS